MLSLNVMLDAGEDVVAIVVRKVWYRVFSKKRRIQIEKLVRFSKVVRMRRRLVSVVFYGRLSFVKHDPEKARRSIPTFGRHDVEGGAARVSKQKGFSRGRSVTSHSRIRASK